jgi:hypothetical protein
MTTTVLLVTSACTTPVGIGPAPLTTPQPSEISTFRDTLATGVHEDPGGYVGAGYDQVSRLCTTYFDDLIKLQDQVGYLSDVTAAAGTATTALVALRTNATTAARLVSKWAAGFALANTIVQKYDDRILMTPYPSETKTLIMAALSAYANANPPEKAQTPAQADAFVTGYAEMCTYSGISRFAKQALSNANPKTGSAATLSASDQGFVTAIADALGVPSAILTLRQVALLDYYIDVNPTSYNTAADADHVKALLAELPPNVAAIFTSNGSNLDPAVVGAPALKLLQAFAASNDDMKAQLDDIKAGFAAPVTPAQTVKKPATANAPATTIVVPPKLATSGVAATSAQPLSVRF